MTKDYIYYYENLSKQYFQLSIHPYLHMIKFYF